ncbi:MAG: cytochrome c biogenesis protein CcdA [Thermomicrobiales bacterium]|nr:cytochrome c biogenesis protein CcdA [Thermomicrobiales bacterium]
MGTLVDRSGSLSDRGSGQGRREWLSALSWLVATLLLLVAVVIVVAAMGAVLDEPELASDVIALAIPAFAAGVFSILSPCSLPIVVGYFTLALQEDRARTGRMTVAFLLGVGTTMAIIGAGFTALGSFAIDYQETLVRVGGVLIILFGLMSIAGKGFGGFRMVRRSGISISGAYLYGLVFALGWTTCVGPILGSILTLLLAEGSSAAGALSLVAGGTLSLIYVLGLGLPILVLVSALQSAGPNNPVARALRGRGWEVAVGGRTLYLHSTQVISGVLLIVLGVLLFSGQMTAFSEQLATSPLTELGLSIERWVDGLW